MTFWSLYISTDYSTIIFIIGLSGIGLGYAFSMNSWRRFIALTLGSLLIAFFSYLENNLIFFWLNLFFAFFSVFYLIKSIYNKKIPDLKADRAERWDISLTSTFLYFANVPTLTREEQSRLLLNQGNAEGFPLFADDENDACEEQRARRANEPLRDTSGKRARQQYEMIANLQIMSMGGLKELTKSRFFVSLN